MAKNLQKLNTTKVTTPHAAVKIWNYRDRINADGLTYGIDDVDQIIVSTVSLLSINISKSKGRPSGNFELLLAPTKNWIQTLTPGSWLVIMLSNDPIVEDDFNVAKADKVKLFGRIGAVEVQSQMNQDYNNSKVYKVTGSDWAQIFESILYVDPTARNFNESAISVVSRFIYENYLKTISEKSNIPSSRDNISALIDIWGKTNTTFAEISEKFKGTNVIAKPEIAFSAPQAVINYFGFQLPDGNFSNKLTSLINLQTGKLIDYDTYDNNSVEAVGIIKPDSIFGANSFWQVLMDNSNHVLNEMVADLRWENNKNVLKPKLTLYNRIKPFIIREKSAVISEANFADKVAKPNEKKILPLISKFSDIRKIEIPLENILSINAAANWQDKYNYAEIQVDRSLIPDALAAEVKIKNAIYDRRVFGREGFKPLILTTKYIPPLEKDSSYDILSIYNWKYLLKEWYFETHNTLSGTIVFTGINDYIQVGDNVIFRSEALGFDNNMNSANVNNKNTYLLAHVENISHSFALDQETKTRTFITSIQFVRGIITDEKGQQFNQKTSKEATGVLDRDTRTLGSDQEDNSTAISREARAFKDKVAIKDKFDIGGSN